MVHPLHQRSLTIKDLTNQDHLNRDTGHGKLKLPMIHPRQKKIGGKVIFLIMFRRNTKIRRTSREDACLFLRGESMMQHLHHHHTHTMPLMATLGTSRSMSHPFLRTKIGCIKDSCAPQETVAHIS
jgi:hypothetical protein